MKIKIPKRSKGRIRRAVMIMTGRKGRRPLNKAYFLQHRERILTAWSRTNLEGRIKSWTCQHALPSVVIAGEQEYGDMNLRWTETGNALWRAMLWRR